jgi:flagellin
VTAANKGITAIQSLLTSAQTVANQALSSAQALVTVSGSNTNALATTSTIATTLGSATRFKAGDTVTVNDGTTTATYTAANGDTVQTFLNAISAVGALKATASLNSNGQIQIAATSNTSLTIGGTTTGTGTLSSVVSLVVGTTNYTTNTVRSGLATQFDSLRSQIDQAASDAGFNGVNFLTGSSSTVTFNETGTSKIVISGSLATSTALGVSASTNSFQLDTDINTALSNITKALSSLQAISTTIGSMATIMQTRVDFNKAMVDTLNTGADTLTSNDMNADSATLLALQTRQQIAATSLSLTRGGDSSALRLFGL